MNGYGRTKFLLEGTNDVPVIPRVKTLRPIGMRKPFLERDPRVEALQAAPDLIGQTAPNLAGAETPTVPFTRPSAQPSFLGADWGQKVVGDMPLDQFTMIAGALANALAPEEWSGRMGKSLAAMGEAGYTQRLKETSPEQQVARSRAEMIMKMPEDLKQAYYWYKDLPESMWPQEYRDKLVEFGKVQAEAKALGTYIGEAQTPPGMARDLESLVKLGTSEERIRQELYPQDPWERGGETMEKYLTGKHLERRATEETPMGIAKEERERAELGIKHEDLKVRWAKHNLDTITEARQQHYQLSEQGRKVVEDQYGSYQTSRNELNRAIITPGARTKVPNLMNALTNQGKSLAREWGPFKEMTHFVRSDVVFTNLSQYQSVTDPVVKARLKQNTLEIVDDIRRDKKQLMQFSGKFKADSPEYQKLLSTWEKLDNNGNQLLKEIYKVTSAAPVKEKSGFLENLFEAAKFSIGLGGTE